MSNLETITKQSNSFNQGYMQLKQKDVADARQDVMDALHVTSLNTFYARLHGRTAPKDTERVVISEVFKKYGVTENIWGE